MLKLIEFKTIEMSDKDWINTALRKSDFKGCEYSFANNTAWRRLYETQICRYKNFYISCSHKDGTQFIFPAGKGDYNDVFTQMRAYADSKNSPLVIHSVTNENLSIFEELYSGQFEVSQDDGGFDYIYNAVDLQELKGKKYHGKRNHIHRFCENNWDYIPLTEEHFDDCIEFAVNNYNDRGTYDECNDPVDYDNQSSVSEQFAINTFFNNFGQLELSGGIIRVDGKIAGFTIGEGINSDSFCVHIEKANAEIQGAYAAINNQFAKTIPQKYCYINREEDLGLEGLRKAKRSYYPAFMLVKNTVTFKN